MLDKMARVIVCEFVAATISLLTHEAGYRVTQVMRHRLISALLYILLDP